MKMPDEIKKALKCHRDGRACHDCPYEQGRTFSVDGVTFGCSKDIVADALDYIERLEAKMEERTMSETPKCPGCGSDMELMRLFKDALCYTCKCGWDSPVGIDSESAFRMAMRRAEPKNRVLTLEEARNAEVDTFGTAMHWLELKIRPYRYEDKVIKCAVLSVSIFFEDESEDGVPDVMYSCTGEPDAWLRQRDYGRSWRCWLRKPTKEEMEGTPWEA